MNRKATLKNWTVVIIASVMLSVQPISAFAADADRLVELGVVSDLLLEHDAIFLDDIELTRSIQTIVNRLVSANRLENDGFRVKILNGYLPNAFSTANRTLYVSTGLLDYLENEDELAQLLAHQIAHVEAAHNFEEFSDTIGSRRLIVGAGILAMVLVTVATAGVGASAAAAGNAAAANTAINAGSVVSSLAINTAINSGGTETSRVRFAKAGISGEHGAHPVYAPALFRTLNQAMFDGMKPEFEQAANTRALALLEGAGYQSSSENFLRNRLRANLDFEVLTHVGTHKEEFEARGEEASE